MNLLDLKIKSDLPTTSSDYAPLLSKLDQLPVLVFCFPGRRFSGQFLKCWTDTIQYCLREGIEYVLSSEYSSMVHFSRTKCLGANVLRGKNQVPFDGKISYTHLMWIDSDVVWHPMHIHQLLLRNAHVVSGLYSHDRSNFVAYKEYNWDFFRKEGHFEPLKNTDIEKKEELIEVAYTGMGFMLVKQGVFESLEYPWFTSPLKQIDDNVQDIISEDASFCMRVQEKGFKVFVDPKVCVGHEKAIIV